MSWDCCEHIIAHKFMRIAYRLICGSCWGDSTENSTQSLISPLALVSDSIVLRSFDILRPESFDFLIAFQTVNDILEIAPYLLH